MTCPRAFEDPTQVTLGRMKVVLTVLLILFVLLLALPLGMGMSEMADCPTCTAPDIHQDLGICFAIVSIAGMMILHAFTRFRPVQTHARSSLISRHIYRPPRFG